MAGLEAALRFFQAGQTSLISLDTRQAMRDFKHAATLYQEVGSKSEPPEKCEQYLNAAICSYHAGDWVIASKLLDMIIKPLLSNESQETYYNLVGCVRSRLTSDFWKSLKDDFRQLMKIGDYKAVLDILRTDPYLLDDNEYRVTVPMIFGRMKMPDVAKSFPAETNYD